MSPLATSAKKENGESSSHSILPAVLAFWSRSFAFRTIDTEIHFKNYFLAGRVASLTTFLLSFSFPGLLWETCKPNERIGWLARCVPSIRRLQRETRTRFIFGRFHSSSSIQKIPYVLLVAEEFLQQILSVSYILLTSCTPLACSKTDHFAPIQRRSTLGGRPFNKLDYWSVAGESPWEIILSCYTQAVSVHV